MMVRLVVMMTKYLLLLSDLLSLTWYLAQRERTLTWILSSEMLSGSGCQTRLVHGMMYNPLTNSWSWAPSASVNFALHSVKS